MSDFGGLESLDISRLMRVSEDYAARSDELQKRILAVKGHAASEDKRVKVTCSASGGVEDLYLDPRALRMPAAELAKTIKDLIRDAGQDLNAQIQEAMADVMGEDGTPAGLEAQKDALQKKVQDAAAAHQRAVNDAFGELDRIRREFDL
jgi:DNA-binding protein YbaB